MNTLYPGQPDYIGPDAGLACWVHHELPLEYCTSFAERIAYIRAKKPLHEQAVRLAALTCLPLDRLPADLVQAVVAYDQAVVASGQARAAYAQARTASDQARKAYDQAGQAMLGAMGSHRPVLLALMAELVPAHLWHGDALVFPVNEEAQP